MNLVRPVWFLVFVASCYRTIPSPDEELPFDGPETSDADDPAVDPARGGDPGVADRTPGDDQDVTGYFEVGFIDRDGPVISDPADPDIPPVANLVELLRSDDGSVRTATELRVAAHGIRFVPPADPADAGHGDGSAVVLSAFVEGTEIDAAGLVLIALDPESDDPPVPLLPILPPDSLDIDFAGSRVVLCGMNYSPCPCCGIRAKAHVLDLAGGEDVVLQDSLNEALAMHLMTGALECQFGMDGGATYAFGKDMERGYALVRASLGNAEVTAEIIPEAGGQGMRMLDVSPDDMRIAFVSTVEDGGSVTVLHLEGAEVPLTISDAGDARSDEPQALSFNLSPRWCDSTHLVWQTIERNRRTIFLGDVATGERIAVWTAENRVPLSETGLDCRVREAPR